MAQRDTKTRQQVLLERSEQAARVKSRERFSRGVARGDVTQSQSVRKVASYWMEPLTRAIAEFVNQTGRGRKRSVGKKLETYDPELLAYITIKEALNHVIVHSTMTSCYRRIGSAIEIEAQLAHFHKTDRGAFNWVTKQLKKRRINSPAHKKAFYRTVMRHKAEENPALVWHSWSQADQLEIGAVLVWLLCKSTDLATLSVEQRGRKKYQKVSFAPAVLTWIEQNRDHELIRPERLPMVEKPEPWTAPDRGGYPGWGDKMIRAAWDKNLEPHFDLLSGADLGPVYGALNTLQETPYVINKKVLAVLEKVWAAGGDVGKVPGREDLPPIPRPPGAKSRKENGGEKANQLHIAWCKQERNRHEKNDARASQELSVERVLNIALLLKDDEALYFPHNLDFRGRFYSIPTDLQPQGVEYARALLRFAKGKAVKTDEALAWLQVHGANCYGKDKCGMEERVAWVRDNFENIRKTARYPWAMRDWWSQADKPWMFLAWVFDYWGVLQGEPSYIAVSMDGSCNGLQHFSAMLRDPLGAKAVNLEPQAEPQDIYQEVADAVVAKLKRARGQKRLWAREFLAAGVDRKVCKRAVMVMPYGGTLHSTKRYVEEVMVPRLPPNCFGDQHLKALHWLALLVHDTTREIVQGAKEAMDWLQECARVAAKKGVHLHWSLPHGFVAHQRYTKRDALRLKTYVNGVMLQVKFHESTEEYSPKDSTNGIAPNVVHSLDACALALTVQKCRGLSLMMVHDDYGTHAADTPRLARALREVFVGMYSKGDFMEWLKFQFERQVGEEMPEPPKKGTFDVKKVMKSKYFFA